MNKELNEYIKSFSTLRTDKNQKRWSAKTCSRAPHKPFLLLSIIDLISSGIITDNFIEPSFDLAETFTGYWSRIMPIGTSGSMSYPFYYLESSGFWNLVARPNIPHAKGRTIRSVKRLRELYLGASFNDDLFSFLLYEDSRKKLQLSLITNFFSQEVQRAVWEQGVIHQGATKYSTGLLTTNIPINMVFTGDSAAEKTKNKIRDQGFRKAIVNLYEHRCALCGIRMLTPEGHTIVEAAHIIPWSESHNDKPQNGMALCRLCHWSFDEGLMGVGRDYEVLVSPAVRQDKNFPGHMETLSGRGIFKPLDQSYWPEQKNLESHRKRKFRLS